MPELPEVEAVCRKIRRGVQGQTMVAARILRPEITKPQNATQVESRLTGGLIERLTRRGKNILIHVSKNGAGWVLHLHLRMTGNLSVISDIGILPVATRFVLEFADASGMVFTDARALGRVHVHQRDEMRTLMSTLGPEPLSRGFTSERLAAAARASSQRAKPFLMDQSRIAGLGNIYAAEALFQAGIHPARRMKGLPGDRIEALHAAIVNTLRRAIRFAAVAYSRPGYWGEETWDYPLEVYDRQGEPCMVCGRAIRKLRQGGRSTYYCPGCQR